MWTISRCLDCVTRDDFVNDRNKKKALEKQYKEENNTVSKSYSMSSKAQQRQRRDILERKASPTRRRILKIAAKRLIERDILQVPVMKNQAHVFSFKREEPTARSVVDQGEFPIISPAGLGPCGKVDVERWLLRPKVPQFPALPARTCPFTRGWLFSPDNANECPGEGPKSSDPLKECRGFEFEVLIFLELLLYPTISIRARLCLPRSGPAVTGAGDFAVIGSGAGNRIPLLAKEGYADLFCFTEGPSKAEVSTLSEPVGGRPPVNWKPLGFISIGVDAVGLLLAEIRARRERDASFGSLLVLIERERPSGRCCIGALSAPGVPAVGGAPELGSSVWIKQQRLPYGQEPETQNVRQISVLYFGCLDTLRSSSSP